VSVPRFQHGNHLDSASLELDGDAAVISYEEFHPFGTTSYAANDSAVEVSAKRYRYIGKERDEETGLYHLGARYYASWLGRWTAADPTGLADGVNRYAYCRGNPITLRDPDGSSSRPSMAEVSSYEAAAERHNTEVGTWHAEVATFDGAAKNAGHTARRLEQQRVSLLTREHALSKTWAALVVRTADADISEFRARESERQLEFGGPDPWTLSGRTMNRLGGVAKLSGGVSGTLASGGLGAVMGADFIQAGVRQFVSGEESDTVMRGGTALLSEGAFGQSARSARVHGDIAETLAPVSLGAWQLGRSAGAAAPTRVAATRAAMPPPFEEGGGNGAAALDTNALIGAAEEGQVAAVDAGLAGRIPVVPLRAAREFLGRASTRAERSSFLRQFLGERGGRIDIANAASEAEAVSLQSRVSSVPVPGGGNRVIKDADAAIGASAEKAGLELLSFDKRLVAALNSIAVQASRLFNR
ncbi:MAG: RHS repeat-associated core domain-containing protein, partial [Nannocystaceae bacterium]|nr:RHS repeat-associated core domain-containing protein [Nannocystaceae bacterium]